MPWVEVFAAFFVCHLVGDYLVQTDWQAAHKAGGLGGDALARRALVSHIVGYTLAFGPALVWLADDIGASVAAVAAGVSLPHLVQDDGRLLDLYLRRVKHCDPVRVPAVRAAADQAFHMLALFALAVIAGT